MAPQDATAALSIAGRFLTRFPFPVFAEPSAGVLARAPLFYPVIGAMLGALLACLAVLAQLLVPNSGVMVLVPASLLLGAWVWSTGALHLDGLADCADAWVGGLGSRERTLAIMKDPHIGAMGVIALVVLLQVKLVALAGVLSAGAGWSLLALPILARAMILWLVLTTPAAVSSGLGAALAKELPRALSWWSAVLGTLAAVSVLALWSAQAAILVSSACALLFWAWRASLLRRLGGYTGDGIGALVELTEALALLALALAVVGDAA